MNTMAPTCPTEVRSRRVRLAAGPAAVPEARGLVTAAIASWGVPVDAEAASLLTSELVTNAILHAACQDVVLDITCHRSRLRVDVHDTSRSQPAVVDVPADAETGRGLLLVAALSAEWGFYPTPAGKAVYFTLAPPPGPVPRPADANGDAGPAPGRCPPGLQISESARE
jgi:anti-sigma regulatory factor (Ser/Thr protein kinase)